LASSSSSSAVKALAAAAAAAASSAARLLSSSLNREGAKNCDESSFAARHGRQWVQRFFVNFQNVEISPAKMSKFHL
jgi:hypothetical protein